MREQKQNVNVDVSGLFTTLLTILFIGLKLTGHITWSWWWVLSPIWISFSVAMVLFVVILLWAALTKRI